MKFMAEQRDLYTDILVPAEGQEKEDIKVETQAQAVRIHNNNKFSSAQ